MTKATSLMGILGRPTYVRVLMFLRKEGPSRFSEIENAVELNPKTVDAALKDMRRGLWIIPVTSDDADGGRILVKYELSKRGRAILELLDELQEAAHRRERALGIDAVRELDSLLA